MGSRLATFGFSGIVPRKCSAFTDTKLLYSEFLASQQQEAGTTATTIEIQKTATSSTSAYEKKCFEYEQRVLRLSYSHLAY